MRRREPPRPVLPRPVALVRFELADWDAAVAADPQPPRWWTERDDVYPWHLFVARRAWVAARQVWRQKHGSLGAGPAIPAGRGGAR